MTDADKKKPTPKGRPVKRGIVEDNAKDYPTPLIPSTPPRDTWPDEFKDQGWFYFPRRK